MSALVPCIIAGGAGTRLWPVSREAMPKPFMRLADGQSLLQKTFERVVGLADVAQLLTVINRELLFRTLDDYRPLNHGQLSLDFLLEPFGRNTAPAIAAAALHVARHHGEDAHLLVLPADHLIREQQAFVAAIAQARELANAGWLVTFGICPDHAETGYGYIQLGDTLEAGGHVVASFVEKPDQATAHAYLAGGNHLWNAGMFCFRADVVLRELRERAAARRAAWLQSLVGETMPVLAERDGTGYAPNYARVALPAGTAPGTIIEVTPSGLREGLLA